MLKLVFDGRKRSLTAGVLPKCILLQDQLTTLGRGYKNDIKLLLPFVSRRHLSLTYIDGVHFLETVQQSVVFVGGVRAKCKVLSNGCKIVIGGTKKSFMEGSSFPKNPGPHVVYEYKVVKEADLFGQYREPNFPETELIALEEFTGGRFVKETYHMEDFNGTMDEDSDADVPVDNAARIGSLSATSLGSSLSSQTVGQFPMDTDDPLNTFTDFGLYFTDNGNTPGTSGLSVSSRRGAPSSSVHSSQTLDLTSLTFSASSFSAASSSRSKPATVTRSPNVEPAKVTSAASALLNTATTSPGDKTDTLGLSQKQSSDREDDNSQNKLSVKRNRYQSLASWTRDWSSDEESSVKKPRDKRNVFAEDNNDCDVTLLRSLRKRRSTRQADSDDGDIKLNSTMSKLKVVHKSRSAGVKFSLADWSVPLEEEKRHKIVTLRRNQHSKSADYRFADDEIFKEDLLSHEITINVNVTLLERKLILGTVVMSDILNLLKIVSKHVDRPGMTLFDECHPSTSGPLILQPAKLKLKLKPYQSASVNWMSEVERKSQNGEEWSHSCCFVVEGCRLSFDLLHKRILIPPVDLQGPHGTMKIRVKGGILADEMGLGKTITVIGLITHNRAAHLPVVPDRQSALRSNLIECRTTLIIAPSHLTKQWQEEFANHSPSLRVLVITTKPQHEKICYVDILESDVVIISVQFVMQNKHFSEMPLGDVSGLYYQLRRPGHNILKQTAPNLSHFLWWRLVCDEAHELVSYEVSVKGVISPSNGLKKLIGFQSCFRWYVTGTPFPKGIDSLRGALKFLEFNVTSDDRVMDTDGSVKFQKEMVLLPAEKSGETFKKNSRRDLIAMAKTLSSSSYISAILEFVRNNLFVKNTKDLIRKDYDVPQYIEELMLLTLSDVEKGLYEHCLSDHEKRQLCCHLNVVKRIEEVVGSFLTLDEVKKAMIEHTKTEMNGTEADIKMTKYEISDIKTEIRLESAYSKRVLLEKRLERVKQNLADFESKLRQQGSSVAYLESLANHKDDDKDCVVCFDEIKQLTLTPCGHMFCNPCIKSCIAASQSCPTCRRAITESQLVVVKDEYKQKESLNKSAEIKQLTEKYGTKMAHLIFYLRYLFKDNPKSRVIIFSQWDRMLTLIGTTLLDNGILNVFVKGNVFVRNRAITSFKSLKDTRVIMLSLEHAASGTNLTEATHIILIDPVAGSKSEAFSTEQQAIGRAHRMGQNKQLTVVRLIMRDTIEQTLYERNKRQHAATLSLNVSDTNSSNNQYGVEIVRTVCEVVDVLPEGQGSSSKTTEDKENLEFQRENF